MLSNLIETNRDTQTGYHLLQEGNRLETTTIEGVCEAASTIYMKVNFQQ
jgi:hypothetical protein